MRHRPHGRQRSRNSWSALLVVLLGALTGASTFSVCTGFAGGLSVAGHGTDARIASKPATVRPDRLDASLDFGGLDDPALALAAHEHAPADWPGAPAAVAPVALTIPADVARTRDGRTRAPPQA